MTLLQYLALDPFPWVPVLGWGFLGLVAGVVISVLYWGADSLGWLSHLRLAIVGAVIGGVLGMGYTMLFGVCRLALG
jgi:uncharacterized membrane protein YeaQ/YmgE (transglycosylase-associated protein family)